MSPALASGSLPLVSPEKPFLFPSQFSSVAQLCLTLGDLMDCSRPGFPVHHQLLELAQTHVHRVDDAIPIISASDIPFFSCLQYFPASGFFPMSHLFTSGGQSTECMAHRTLLNGSTKANYFNCTVSSLLINKFPSESMSVSPICS